MSSKKPVDKGFFTQRHGKPNYLVMGLRTTNGCCYTNENWWWTKLFRVFDTKAECVAWIRSVGAERFLTMGGHDTVAVVRVPDVLKLEKTLDNYNTNPYGRDTWYSVYREDYEYLYSCPVETAEWNLNADRTKWILDKKPLKPFKAHQTWR